MTTAVVKGYQFRPSPSNGVIVTGPGIQRAGIQISGDIKTLNLNDFQGWEKSPNVTPEAAAVLASFDDSDINTIKETLTPQPPAPPQPIPPPTPAASPPGGQQADNKADEDKDKGVKNTSPASNVGTIENNTGTSGASATTVAVAGSTGTTETAQTNTKGPGARKDNPLSKFSSYTYTISLYLVTPEIMNKFTSAGGTFNKTDAGVYIVAQSGGINSDIERRAIVSDKNKKHGYDYYIDDLNIQTLYPGGPAGASVGTTINFKIFEPHGFSFLTDLSRAAVNINQESNLIKNSTAQPNSIQQNYIIGVKFSGYDRNGEIITGNDSDKIERYFPIIITDIKFKIDGRVVVYQCGGLIMPEKVAYGQVNGTIKKQTNIVASTVGEALQGRTGPDYTAGLEVRAEDGSLSTSKRNPETGELYTPVTQNASANRSLAQILNEDNKDQQATKIINVPNEYAFQFKPESSIPGSKLVDDVEFSKQLAPMASISSSNKSTVAESYKAGNINTNSKGVSIAAGQSILKVIDNIIVKSRYITDALTQNNNEIAATDTVPNAPTKKLSWYSVNPLVEIKGRDEKTNNWAYKITYQISEYDVPYIRTQYKGVTSKYPGPYKLYNYWLTGENSEVISYEQQYDNLFYTITPMVTNIDNSAGRGQNKTSVPSAPQNTAGATDATGGKQNRGSEINEQVRAALYSPTDQSMAKIKILGDPDYLNNSSGVNLGFSGQTFQQFYGKDLTISPLGGQVFIQVVFNMATDYTDSGVLDISDKLQFYETDAVSNAEIKGIVYMITQVDSSFSAGKFIQTLDCLMVPQSQLLVQKATDSTAAMGAATDDEARAINQALANEAADGVGGSGFGVTGLAYQAADGVGGSGFGSAATTAFVNNAKATDLRKSVVNTAGGAAVFYRPPAKRASPNQNNVPTRPNVTQATPQGRQVVDDDSVGNGTGTASYPGA
jgi:hypothetical protein